MPGRERNERIAVKSGVAIRRQNQAPVRHARKHLNGPLNVGRRVPNGTEHNLDRKRRRRGLRLPQEVVIIGSRPGLTTRAARVRCGATSLRIASHLPVMLASKSSRPVILPPGRAKLATKPEPTGSVMLANTIGIVTVSR